MEEENRHRYARQEAENRAIFPFTMRRQFGKASERHNRSRYVLQKAYSQRQKFKDQSRVRNQLGRKEKDAINEEPNQRRNSSQNAPIVLLDNKTQPEEREKR